MSLHSSLSERSGIILWTLLSFVAFVFAVAAWTAFYLWRHARAPIPPHVQFVESLTHEPEEC